MDSPISNRFRQAPNAIAYNVVKFEGGWRVEARFPKHLSAEDKLTVLNWFQQYRSQVRKLHPLWVTSFFPSDHGYSLEVRPVENPKELLENGQNLKRIWTDEIANRA